MQVKWSYEGLTFAHTKDETDDLTAHSWTGISPTDLIYHAANLHLFRVSSQTAKGVDADFRLPELWLSPGNAPPEGRVGRPIL
jgi:hypothetical protein